MVRTPSDWADSPVTTAAVQPGNVPPSGSLPPDRPLPAWFRGDALPSALWPAYITGVHAGRRLIQPPLPDTALELERGQELSREQTQCPQHHGAIAVQERLILAPPRLTPWPRESRGRGSPSFPHRGPIAPRTSLGSPPERYTSEAGHARGLLHPPVTDQTIETGISRRPAKKRRLRCRYMYCAWSRKVISLTIGNDKDQQGPGSAC